MYAYNEDGKMITGPVTEAENQASKLWGSWVYKGDRVTIELKTPIKSKDRLILHASSIAYGYKEMYKVAGFGASGPCEVNVLCPLGTGWEGERNSVALLLIANGQNACSGSLVMNTCSSNKPNFLTANHCYAADPNVAGWRFTFQAWSLTCSPSQNSNGVTFNGSVFRATNAASDFCLVELNNTPPANSNIFYAGWNKSATPATQATGIHHPAGDVMKISRDNDGVVRASYGSSTNQHWRTDWSPQNNGAGQTVTPITEGGSSGSPLFDQNHRVIGQLHGGPSVCSGAQLWDFYGSFDLSWTGGGTSTTRLSNWLDPSNAGSITTNTTNISALGASASGTVGPITDVTESKVNNGCVTETSTYTVVGAAGATNYKWYLKKGSATTFSLVKNSPSNSYSFSQPNKGTTCTPYIVKVEATNCTTTPVSYSLASATCPCNFVTRASDYTITASPNPTTDNVRIAVAQSKNAVFSKTKKALMYKIKVTDPLGNVRKEYKYSSGTSNTTISLKGFISGMYTIQAYDGTSWSSVKVIKQ